MPTWPEVLFGQLGWQHRSNELAVKGSKSFWGKGALRGALARQASALTCPSQEVPCQPPPD